MVVAGRLGADQRIAGDRHVLANVVRTGGVHEEASVGELRAELRDAGGRQGAGAARSRLLFVKNGCTSTPVEPWFR